ncbi:Brix_domain containing protein [Hexamita inflata]|uniref:Ribosome production factor 2 homolog n=1 Tax=Hexamita inflata TaxID=28002 RepID=A0AA86PPR6_9EUKA|nr:Brix domain containing protein [Hexamita inflata]CAI9938867.1 Brix domain containing protein [Hexamita inflata]CAI9948617.1 Brix domain containing protein [Hexamita inflata]CAI9949217.1 Brix domain containing protein [Hexamita inflata]
MQITKALPREPKTMFGRRKLEEREAKLVENDKKTIICGTASASRMTLDFARDLAILKAPLAQRLHTAVENPINDKAQIQQLSKTTDSSLFVHISHTKKRQDNVIFGRMFDHEVAEMFEFQLQTYIGLQDVSSKKPMPQCKPILLFQGDGFNNDDDFRKIKSILQDTFKGRNYDKLSRDALQWVIAFTANNLTDKIIVRSYVINDVTNTTMKQVEEPVHLTPMGFQFELIRRRREVNALLVQKSMVFEEKRKRKDGETVNAEKIEKGIETDEIGRKFAAVHVGMADVKDLNLRKFKGFKEAQLSDESDGEQQEEQYEEMYEDEYEDEYEEEQ